MEISRHFHLALEKLVSGILPRRGVCSSCLRCYYTVSWFCATTFFFPAQVSRSCIAFSKSHTIWRRGHLRVAIYLHRTGSLGIWSGRHAQAPGSITAVAFDAVATGASG